MSAKQRHKQRVIERLKEKLENLAKQEDNLHTVVSEHVLKAERKCMTVLRINDTNQFLQKYGKVEQLLDQVFNLVEILTSSAEEMIEDAEHDMTGDLEPDDTTSFVADGSLLSSTQLPADDKDESMKDVRDKGIANPALERQLSDEEIKKELLGVMSAKQRHKQRVIERLKEKLENLAKQEDNLHTVVSEHVLKAERKCMTVLRINDTNQFLQKYGKVEQLLDQVFNLVEILTSSAEEMIEDAEHDMTGDLEPDDTTSFVADGSLLSSTQLPADDKDESMKDVRDKGIANPALERQLSDEEIKKELLEMIKSSSSKRRGSSEAASQTMPREIACEENTKTELCNIVCQTTQSTIVKKDTERSLETKPDREIGVYESSFDQDCEICEKQAAKDPVIEKQVTEVKKRLNDVQNKKSLENIDGNCKSEKVVVPRNVRKHLTKDSSPDTDGCSSSQNCSPVNADRFTKDVTLASSPKRKTTSPKKKKSQRKRTEKKSIADSWLKTKHSIAELYTNLNKTDIPIKDITNEKLCIEKPIMEQVELDNDIVNTMLVKSEQSENLDTPNVNSSEQIILEHKLTATKTNVSTGSEILGRSDLKTPPKDEHMGLIVHDSVKSSSENISHTSDRSQQHMGAETVAAHGNSNDKLDAKGDNTKHERLSPGALIAEKITPCETMDLPKGDNIKTCSLTPGSLLAGKITSVVVSEVVSPWCFFLQQNGLELNQLMEEICIYMSQGGLMKPSLLEPEVGTVCLAKYSKDMAFYRAVVTHTYKALDTTASEADVLYVDYGNREKVKVTQLRSLPQKFSTLPTQAICCALAEVMPCNKYCVWTEDDIHLFQQYVAGRQLSCTPPMCPCSGASLPLLVELIASYTVHAVSPGSMYLSQFSIAQQLINANKARHVKLPEQIGLLAKSGEGAEEAAILSHNMTAISDLDDSHCESSTTVEPVQAKDTETTEPASTKNTNNTETVSRKDVDTTESIKDTESAEPVDVDKSLSPTYEQASADHVIIEKIVDISNLGDASTRVKHDLISPRLENSDTESQRDEGTDKGLERGQHVTEMSNSRGHLDKIKEEVLDLDISETASTTTSHTTDLDFPPEQVIQLSDLHFDLDDLSFNPQGQEVMLAHVKSPDEFFVHIISQQSGETLDRLMKSLNMLFEKTNRRKLTRLSKTFESVENKLCCAQFLQDNNFYRGIILNTKPEKDVMKGRVLVHYIDFGEEEWLPRRRIFPLPPQLCTVPRLALRCSLSYIKPVCTLDGEPAKWSNQSVEKFVDIAGLEKTLHMHVVHGGLEQYKTSEPSDDAPVLGILLVDNTGKEEVCINMDLIREGVAQLDTSQSKPDKDGQCVVENVTERLDTWNPMEEDFLSKRNSYKIDTDDVGVATTGYKARDEETICKFYSTGRCCWRGDRCPFRHVKVESGVTYDKEQVYAIVDNQSDFIPLCGSWVAMEITTILSPSHFYSILPMGNRSLDDICSEPEKSESAFGETGSEETLDDLLAALNTEYSKRPTHEGSLLLKAMGEVVVARFSTDHQWYRARVVDVTEEKVKVFFVDFGNTEWLPEEDIADMKPEFLHLPFQAIECFLNVEPKGDEKWSKHARVEFRELVDGKTLVGNVRSRSWNGCLWVELFDTATEDDVNIGEVLVDRGHAMKMESPESHTDVSSNFSEIGQSHSTTDIKEILVPG